MRNRIGLDLGGTKIEGVALDSAGSVLARKRVPTRAERGYEAVVETAGALFDELAAIAGPVGVVGVGTPGAVSRRTGLLRNSNTQCLNGRDLAGDLAARLARPVVLENDANCFALAEASLGAGRGFGVVFGVIMGTGVGGGIVFDGRTHAGPQHIAGEWGHHSIDPNGADCYCGNRGCVETCISGPAVEARYLARAGRALGCADIAAASRAGDVVAAGIFERFLDDFGRALANLVDILDPDAVVLGGGLSNLDQLYTAGRDAVARYVFNDELATPILRNQLGDSAGVIGAALLTRSEE
jgi:fructokinase